MTTTELRPATERVGDPSSVEHFDVLIVGELVTGPGSSHGMHIERPEDLVRIMSGFLSEHTLLQPT